MSNNTQNNILETFIANQSGFNLLLGEEHAPEVILAAENTKLIGLEKFAAAPKRICEEQSFSDLRGFIDYVNDFKGSNTVCFTGTSGIRAYFDYHGKDDPRWNDHIACFGIKKSNRWKIWEDAHNQWMPQKKFADFLDSGLNEIQLPSQSEILNLVKNFRATTSYELDSEATPGGGENLTYRKSTKSGTALKSEIILPEYITLALEPFENISVINSRLPDDLQIPAYQLKAKISWMHQINGDESHQVGFKVQILNVENVINETMETIKNAVVELTKIKVYIA